MVIIIIQDTKKTVTTEFWNCNLNLILQIMQIPSFLRDTFFF